VRSQKRSSRNTDLADRVKSIIESKGLTLHAISQKSAAIFGQASPYFLHHNFYYELNLGSFSPSPYQLFALSRISNYRLFDWLHVFGLDLEQIPRLEILLPTRRTVLLDSTLADPNAWVRWFRNKWDHTSVPAVAPLSQVLEPGIAFRQRRLLGANRTKFLYAKIGRGDAFAFPDLLPGSIVRVNRAIAEVPYQPSRKFFTAFTQPGSNVCNMKSFQFQEMNLAPVDKGLNSAYDAASHLWAIRCWPQDRAPKLDSG
jgi:hypothetical protein